MRNLRKKIWIDSFQTKISLRIALYFAVYQVAVWALVIIERNISTSITSGFGGFGPGLLVFLTGTVLFLGFAFVWDAIKFTHRIVGPLYRFRKTVQAITSGEPLDLLTLRKGDYLQELRDELNEMIKVLEERGAVSLKETCEAITTNIPVIPI